MNTKERVLSVLTETKDRAVSGQEIAEQLSLSRTSIWKAIKTLQEEGYQIEATTNKGYQLKNQPDVLSKAVIQSLLNEQPEILKVYKQVGSTNDEAKQLANGVSVHKAVLLAEEQTKGRGRLGRSFYSPHQAGLYMSMIYQNHNGMDAATITTTAAVAVCLAIEKLTGKRPGIKWVNDIFLDDRKICGILTEGTVNFETGTIDAIILGIGVNFQAPKNVPSELENIIGSLFQGEKALITRNELAAEILNQLDDLYAHLDSAEVLEEYRKRCFVLGQTVSFAEGEETIQAVARTIDQEGGLVVELPSGQMKTLRYGEISIRLGEKS